MRSLKESILSSTKTGAVVYKEYIQKVADKVYYPEVVWIDMPDITFEEFVANVDSTSMLKLLKAPFKDAAKDSTCGRLTIQFKNGRFGVEIISMGTFFSAGDKWWRQVFLDETKTKGTPRSAISWVSSYNYNHEFTEVSERLGKDGFSTPKGARLNKYVDSYIDFLKKNCKILKA